MQTILYDLKVRLLSPVSIISWIIGSVVCSLTGPFSTYEVDSFGFRVVFWTSILFVSMVLGNAVIVFLLHYRPKWQFHQYLIVAVGSFSTIYGAFVWIAINQIYEAGDLPHPAVLFAVIAFVATAIFAIVYLVSPDQMKAKHPQAETPPQHQEPDPEPMLTNGNSFMHRLSPGAGKRLIRLAMRDHYVEAYTERGQQTLHMRFSDAIKELNGVNGGQIHRSHWVNYDEIKGVVKNTGKTGFEMSDGFVAPISRSRKPGLKQRGLL
ncbi:MAG: LytTR family transcriptional regulator [Rhodobacteraceae bacterium]|nr:LytTR family transcriptional regulator [Paracoccaceae bacterium]